MEKKTKGKIDRLEDVHPMTQITVASGAPTLYYYCTNHSGMGGTANTP